MRLDRTDVKYFKIAIGDSPYSETDLDIAARCPVCGDSRRNRNSKRLHLYKKGDLTLTNCFNGGCAVENKTMQTFLRDFFPSLLSSYQREQFQQNISFLTNRESGTVNESDDVFSSLNDSGSGNLELIDDWTNTDIADLDSNESGSLWDSPKSRDSDESRDSNNSSKSNDLSKSNDSNPVKIINLFPYLQEIEEVPEALKYIESRGIKYQPEKYGKWYYGCQNLEINDIIYHTSNTIVIPLYTDSNFTDMYGFYTRNISNRFFSTFMDDDNIGYKLWNFFNIDTTKEVYIFEGIFDALSSGLDNCIALMGSSITQDRLNELEKPVFVLDNDRTGLKNSLRHADSGYSVYVQPSRYPDSDINDLARNNPDLDIQELINNNIYSGIMARIEISKLL